MNTRSTQADDHIALIIEELLPELETFYKDVHAHPELSMQETRTAALAAERLRANGFEVTTGIGKTGVVGLLSNGDGSVVMLRADMDALPVQEETGLPYASTITAADSDGKSVPVMHACGHDMHVTWLAGAAAGLLQGGIMVGLGLSSVGVTLGGLLTLGGLTYVLTENTTISYPRMDVALLVNDPVLGVLSLRSIVAIAAFIVAGFVMARTRIGRDVVATGSDRRAALIAGVRVDRILIGVFAVSGVLTALAGSLLSYSLAAASPVALADTLIPAAAAAIIGGVSLAGGKGTPAGIAGGVLVLAVLRSGLTAIGVPPFMHDVVTGGVLLAVALLDAGDLERRLFGLRRALGRKV